MSELVYKKGEGWVYPATPDIVLYTDGIRALIYTKHCPPNVYRSSSGGMGERSPEQYFLFYSKQKDLTYVVGPNDKHGYPPEDHWVCFVMLADLNGSESQKD